MPRGGGISIDRTRIETEEGRKSMIARLHRLVQQRTEAEAPFETEVEEKNTGVQYVRRERVSVRAPGDFS